MWLSIPIASLWIQLALSRSSPRAAEAAQSKIAANQLLVITFLQSRFDCQGSRLFDIGIICVNESVARSRRMVRMFAGSARVPTHFNSAEAQQSAILISCDPH